MRQFKNLSRGEIFVDPSEPVDVWAKNDERTGNSDNCKVIVEQPDSFVWTVVQRGNIAPGHPFLRGDSAGLQGYYALADGRSIREEDGAVVFISHLEEVWG